MCASQSSCASSHVHQQALGGSALPLRTRCFVKCCARGEGAVGASSWRQTQSGTIPTWSWTTSCLVKCERALICPCMWDRAAGSSFAPHLERKHSYVATFSMHLLLEQWARVNTRSFINLSRSLKAEVPPFHLKHNALALFTLSSSVSFACSYSQVCPSLHSHPRQQTYEYYGKLLFFFPSKFWKQL